MLRCIFVRRQWISLAPVDKVKGHGLLLLDERLLLSMRLRTDTRKSHVCLCACKVGCCQADSFIIITAGLSLNLYVTLSCDVPIPSLLNSVVQFAYQTRCRSREYTAATLATVS